MTDSAAPRPWRCFVAAPLPDELRRDLAAWVAEARSAGSLDAEWRWSDPDGWHITLAFLGATSPEAVPDIGRRLAADLAGRSAFTVSAGGIGAFPGRSHARVLWYGIRDDGGQLAELAGIVRVATETDAEPLFRPHVTLARARDRHGTALPALAVDNLPAAEVPVRSVVLMRSHLGHGPARYEALAELPLVMPVGARASA